jgi:Zn-dependent metalloprotease
VVFLFFFTAPVVFAQVQSETPAVQALTDTQNHVIQAKRAELTENSPGERFTQGVRERVQSARTALTEPSGNQASKGKKLAAMGSAGAENKATKSLKNKGKALHVWYGPGNSAPRQIKLKPDARKKGDVLMEAIREGLSQRDRDEKTSRAFLAANGPMVRLMRPDEELVLVRYQEDELKRRHLRYQQHYKGIPVWPAEVNVHLDENGSVDGFNSSHVPTPKKLATKPVITSQSAGDLARKAVKAGDGAKVSEPELIVFTDGIKTRLAWKMSLSVSLDAYWLVVVDAHAGSVLAAFNQVYTDGLVNGSGTDLLGTTRALKLWLEAGKHYLVDTSKAMYDNTSDPPAINTTKGAIIVNDMNHTDLPDQGGGFQYIMISSAAANSGWLADGVSLAYNFAQTYDYYKAVHNRNAIDTEGGSILGFVRLGTNYKNAFWTPEYNAMFFGDAKKYAGALDVVAHEYTHGVTSFTCNLIYQDQSGALNEAFSDIFGEMVEARTNGNTDWINGTVLNDGGRDMKNTSSVEIIAGSGYYYPSKMSQFYGRNSPLLQQLVNQDNGGVHINCTIVSHAFYMLAEGLTGAIGNTDAAKIFHRAQTVHLLTGSQFIDARLACITSAEELFGQDSTQAKKTAEAFDAVEIFDNAQTPEPPPTTPVSGEDSGVFIAYDGYSDYYLAAYETAKGGANWLSWYPVSLKRASVSGDGSLAFFVDANNDACFIATDPGAGSAESCLGFPGSIGSVSMSPDAQVYGFVLLDASYQPTNEITVVDLRPGGETRTFTLSAPGTEAASVNTVLFADAMDFTSDNRYLIYDAYNVFKMPDNTEIGVWSIYALDLVAEQIISITEPVKDLEVGNPAVSQTTNHIITFEVFNDTTQQSTVMAMSLLDGNAKTVGTVTGAAGVPGYTGNDGGIVFQKPASNTYTGFSLYRQALQADRLTPTAPPPALVFPAGDYGGAYGVVFRRGTYSPPVPNISVSATSLAFGTVFTGDSATKDLTITNNGTGDLRINTITLTGANAADFEMSGSCSGQLLRASGTCTMSVVFSPNSEGSKTASLSIQSDDPDTPTKAVSLSGTAQTNLVDTDGDGMPDWWETKYGLDKNVNDAGLDKDGDGYTNLEEYKAGTLPNDPNSHPTKGRGGLPWLLLLLSANSSAPTTNELEPNNTQQTSQIIGTLNTGASFLVAGRVSSGGLSGETYTGDLDYYKFTLPSLAKATLKLDWTGTADLDLAVGTQDLILETITASEKPIQLSGPLSPETFYLLIASKNTAADYQLSLSTSSATAAYGNNNALLNGDYYDNGSSILFWYSFNGAGSYGYWTWNSLSGNILNHSGTYSVWYPYLILRHSDEEVEVFDLQIVSSTTIVLNGVTYSFS